MKIAIMQPYFLPYLGYFQLINAVDEFIVFDDVNFINRGWINRNNFLLNGSPFLMTIPLSGASQNKKINEIQISSDQQWQIKFLKTTELCYKKAPHFKTIYAFLEQLILEHSTNTISTFNLKLIEWIITYLNIETKVVHSSSVFCNSPLKAEDRIIDICRQKEADTYINPIGGMELYSEQNFQKNGIELLFIRTTITPYPQISSTFVGNLSILDLMMNLDVSEIRAQLNNYNLITK